MDKLIDKTNLNVNSWLINWGLMKGYLHDGIIQTTKFGLFNQRFSFVLSLYELIRWIMLFVYPIDSQVTHLLGDFGRFFGPKVIVASLLVVVAFHYMIVSLFFDFCAKKSEKFLFWIDIMQYNYGKRTFHKLALNESDSKMLVKRIAIIINMALGAAYSFALFFLISAFISFYYQQNSYYLTYPISIIVFYVHLNYILSIVFGFLGVISLVSLNK